MDTSKTLSTMLKWTRRGVVLGGGLLLILVMLGKFMTFSTSREEIAKIMGSMQADSVPYNHWPQRQNDEGVHVVTIGDPRLPPVVFVHGSPGSVDNWFDLLAQTTILEHAFVILVDRPGFGESNPGVHESHLQRQATALVEAVRPHLAHRPAVWLGHSFGGPVIARIAMDYPTQVKGLVFAAASVDPALEIVRWYQHLAHTAMISWMLPAAVRTTNREIYTLKPQLEAMLPLWHTLNDVPTAIIHGTRDNLVPVGNADFIKGYIPQAVEHRLPQENHFLPWRQPELLTAVVLELVGQAEP